MLAGSPGFTFRISAELGAASGETTGNNLCYCGLSEPSLIWLLPGREVTAGICHCLRTISSVCMCSPNVVKGDVAEVVSIRGLTTTGTINSAVPYFISLSRKKLAASPHPGCVTLSIVICFCQQLSMRCCTVLEIVPITHSGSSSWLSLPSSVSSSSLSSSSPFCPSSELARSLRLPPLAFNISWNIVSGILVVVPALSAVVISSGSCINALSASRTGFPSTAVSLPTYSSIHFSLSLLNKQCVSRLSSAESFLLDRKLRNPSRSEAAQSSQRWDLLCLQASRALIRSMTLWCRVLCRFAIFACQKWRKVLFRALTIELCVHIVVGWDVRCCKIWTTWRQAVSFMSRFVSLINSNKAQSAIRSSLLSE